MSLDNCPACCACPVPVFLYSSVTVTRSRQDFEELFTWSGAVSTSSPDYTNTVSGSTGSEYDPVTDTSTPVETRTTTVSGDDSCVFNEVRSDRFFICSDTSVMGGSLATSGCTQTYTYSGDFVGEYVLTQSSISTEDFEALILDLVSMSTWPSYTTTPASASYYKVVDIFTLCDGDPGVDLTILGLRYKVRFTVPVVGPGTCCRATWVERFIPDAGVAVSSAEITTRGVYRPTATATGGGGSGCVLVVVMNPDGTVASVRILNPGSGYTTPPTITIQTAINGGTTSTGWTATIFNGQVATVTRSGGSAGDYLPTGAFTGGGGAGATITFTLDDQGGLATCPLGSGGSAYAAAPSLAITAKVSGATSARVDLHIGTETEKCATWDGIVPEGATNITLPSADPFYFEAPSPEENGETTLANLRAFCDCSTCP